MKIELLTLLIRAAIKILELVLLFLDSGWPFG
jgi:hypothetical protein